MYHCHLQFYCVGFQPQTVEFFRAIPPLEHFTHAFSESSAPRCEPAKAADVILADLRSIDTVKTLQLLLDSKKVQAQLIILAEEKQLPLLTPFLPEVADVWTAPFTPEVLQFRFRHWQQGYKQDRNLWEARHFLEATINSVPNLVWYKTKDGIHEKVNDSFCRTVNKTKEQVQGRGHAYIWDVEQDDPACIESERIVMTKKETCVSEETIQTGDGTRLLTTYKSPLYDLDGSVMGTVGVAIDVTQERAYEREIIQKNQTLETIFTTMDCGVMRHTLDGSRILSVNRAALEILGYESKEEMTAAGFDTVAASVVAEDQERLRSCIQSLTKPGDNVNIEYQVRHKDGSLLHVMGNVKLVEERGELYYQRFLLDITAQKLRETAERNEAERRQLELVHALSIDYSLVCYFDLSDNTGRILRLEDDDGSLFGFLFSEDRDLRNCLEEYIGQFVHPDDRESLTETMTWDHLQTELLDKKTCYANYRVCINGETRYFQIKVVRAGDWDSHQSIVLGFRDMDQETRREMEKKIVLQDALSQANRASKAKSTFLSNMSHDIRTPMNAIVGFTALAITHIDEKEHVAEYLQKIMASGNHLLSLINDILDMSRIESGKMRLEEQACSLPDILHGLRSIIQADVHAKQLELYIDAVDVMDEEIFCDKLRLNQVLLNLLSNAVKYTGAGGIVSLRIQQKPGAPEGSANYEFHIKDTGIGMSKEFVSHIFEPFERERNSTISGIQGTGLGMAITKNIVDMMNGTIDVESEQGVGSEFTVSFTFRLQSAPRTPQVIPQLKDARALVVDDDFNTCDSVSYMLQQLGLRAEWTLSGREAVLRTRQAVSWSDEFSVYIIDWLLPDMNGVEVARRIRKEVGESVPIIVLTAYDWSDIEAEALQAGVSAFCSKPLFFSELRSCLQSLTGGTVEDAPVQEPPIEKTCHSGRILLAEDNALNQEIATAILEEAGFTIEVANNGQEAVELLKASEPGYYRLILMDVQMPVMDGYTATKAIRKLKNKTLASIPILAMTANAFEEDKQTALRCGMNGHIAKPINVETLLETLDQVLL